MSYLFVADDLNLVRRLTDRVLVMYLGKIVEGGCSEDVFDRPAQPCTHFALKGEPLGHPAHG